LLGSPLYGQAWRDGRPPVAEGVKRAENLPNVHRAAGRVALVRDMEQPQADDFVAIANARCPEASSTVAKACRRKK